MPAADKTQNKKQNTSPLDVDINTSDSDESISLPESENAGIHFQTRHFKRDSSSEEDSGPARSTVCKVPPLKLNSD